ncbi:hypothetical protein NBRC13296_12670 [Paenibacillus chitinolyticus]|uniref:hypothetical protein n=1 Tax=Paenibacillus chitinolyticus TaxID=79263 RepID=UPI0035593656
MALLKFNINIPVHVKLTEHGQNILNDYYTGYGYLKVPELDGYYKFQMHELMNIFGRHHNMGFDVPFENNEIVFVK